MQCIVSDLRRQFCVRKCYEYIKCHIPYKRWLCIVRTLVYLFDSCKLFLSLKKRDFNYHNYYAERISIKISKTYTKGIKTINSLFIQCKTGFWQSEPYSLSPLFSELFTAVYFLFQVIILMCIIPEEPWHSLFFFGGGGGGGAKGGYIRRFFKWHFYFCKLNLIVG